MKTLDALDTVYHELGTRGHWGLVENPLLTPDIKKLLKKEGYSKKVRKKALLILSTRSTVTKINTMGLGIQQWSPQLTWSLRCNNYTITGEDCKFCRLAREGQGPYTNYILQLNRETIDARKNPKKARRRRSGGATAQPRFEGDIQLEALDGHTIEKHNDRRTARKRARSRSSREDLYLVQGDTRVLYRAGKAVK